MWDANDARDYDLVISAIISYSHIQKFTVYEVVNHLNQSLLKTPRILEIGCGTGNTTKLLMSELGRGKLTCIDGSEDMINVAHNRFADKNINFFYGDALEYLSHRVAENSLDAVVTAQTLHNLPRSERAHYYPEISRVLKVGGVFVDGDHFAEDNSVLHYASLRSQIEKLGSVLGIEHKRPDLAIKWIDHFIDDNQPHKIFYEQEFIDKCREFGMKPRIDHRMGMDAVGIAVKYYGVK